MKVLVLSRRPELFSVRRLLEEASAAGHEGFALSPDAPDLTRAEPNVVIPRFGTFEFEASLKALEFFERRKVPIVNRVAPLREARQKWISHLVLREENLPVPSSSLTTKAKLPREYPYVAKIPEGTKGEGVHLVRGADDLLALPYASEWMVQEFIAEAGGRDHRLLVLEGKVVAAMARQAAPGDFRSNLARGGTATPYEPTALEEQIAVAAALALRLDFAGVDLIPSSRGPLVLEVNGSPGLEGIENATGLNLARLVVATALAKAGRP